MNTIKSDLFFSEGSSDKEYHLQIVEVTGGYVVNFQYGRRGSTLKDGSKTANPVPLKDAQNIYDKVLGEKLGKGYKEESGNSPSYISAAIPALVSGTAAPEGTRKVNWQNPIFIPQLLNPLNENDIESFLRDDRYGAQEKKNGKHQSFQRKGNKVLAMNRKGQSIGYPKALEDALLTNIDMLVDSEAIGESFHAFDLLEARGEDLRGLGYGERYKALKKVFDYLPVSDVMKKTLILVPLAIGEKAKRSLYDRLKKEGKEGIVFKRLDALYSPGKGHSDMWKYKFLADASCRVREGRPGKRSVGLELLDEDGQWVPVGNVTVGSPKIPLPLPGQVIDVIYLYAHRGGALYQPIFNGVRDDINENECAMSQLKYKAEEE